MTLTPSPAPSKMMSGTDRGEIDFRNLLDALREHSVIQEEERWQEMLEEWKYLQHYAEDDTCLCGKKHILYCHEVVHRDTGKVMGPIGSSCIDRFDEDFQTAAKAAEKAEKAKIKHEEDGQIIVPANFKKPTVRGKTRIQVWEEQPGYIEWMLDNEKVKNASARKWFTTKLNMS